MSIPEPPRSEPPINPYAPSALPDAVLPTGEPSKTQLYSVTAITLAGFLGAFISAAVLVALNYLRLGKTAAGIAMIAFGIVASVANFALALALPEESPDWPFYFGHTILSYALAAITQPSLLREHQARGGKLANIWWAVGISIAISLFQVVVFLIVIEVVPEKYLGT
jgi:hypothetical protein